MVLSGPVTIGVFVSVWTSEESGLALMFRVEGDEESKSETQYGPRKRVQ